MRRRRERDLEDELRFHLDRAAHETGSHRAAEAVFGGLETIKEDCRAERRTRFAGAWSDLRLGARLLRRAPGFTLAVVLLLALAIGANTAVFSSLDATLHLPLPFHDPGRIVAVVSADTHGRPQAYNPLWSGQFADIRAATPSLAVFAGWSYSDANLSAAHMAVHVQVLHVTRDFFDVWGVAPAVGRTFQRGDGDREIILSGALWRNRLNSARLLGQNVQLNGESYTVIGIMPPEFASNNGLFGPDVWVPLKLTPEQLGAYDRATAATLQAAGRLRPGAMLAQVQAEIAAVQRRDAAAHPSYRTGRAAAITLRQELDLGENASVLMWLQAVAGLLLLMGCLSIAGLLLERGLARAPEMRTRLALGAPRRRLIRQLLTETLLLGLLAFGTGIGMSCPLLRLMNAMLAQGFPVRAGMNMRLLAFGAGTALVTVLLAGLAPAWQVSLARPGGLMARRLRGALIASEIVLATVCLIATATLIAAIHKEAHEPLGFAPNGLVAASVTLAGPAYADPARRAAFLSGLLAAAARLPGVEQTALVSPPALTWDQPAVQAQDRASGTGTQAPPLKVLAITSGYFQAMDIPRLAGRSFASTDATRALPVAIVSRTAAQRLFPGGANPIGRYLRILRPGEPPGWRQVVGEVADMSFYVGEQLSARGNVYEPLAQALPPSGIGLLLRGPGNANNQSALRAAVAQLDPSLPLFNYRPLADDIAASFGGDRQLGDLLFGMDLLVLFSAALGLYGIVGYAAARRRRELAIRVALGETRAGAVRQLAQASLGLAGAGLSFGLGLAWLDSFVLANIFENLPTRSPAVFCAPVALLLAVVLAATILPALRATRLPPAAVLKEL